MTSFLRTLEPWPFPARLVETGEDSVCVYSIGTTPEECALKSACIFFDHASPGLDQ
jgi:hypothetical protein